MNKKNSIGTFTPNQAIPIHSWYPYVEGYSSSLVHNEISSLSKKNVKSIYDPFAGTGTTPLVASQSGIQSFFSETNPFMRFVIETKIGATKNLADNQVGLNSLKELLNQVSIKPKNLYPCEAWGGFEKYFNAEILGEILYIKNQIQSLCEGFSYSVAMLALSAIIVPLSKMTRRGDLRFAKPDELHKKSFDTFKLYHSKLSGMIDDIYCSELSANALCPAIDSRDLPNSFKTDCVITSPPYLNGTNYIRNTKLELKLNDYINTESDLSNLHSKGIVAGINNVSKATSTDDVLPEVEKYYETLLPIAYDKRIPTMVACYFRDMNIVLEKLSNSLRSGGLFVMDIGDSQFAGIHIPTHEILVKLASNHGFHFIENEVLRSRKSKNGMILTQQLIRFRNE